MDHIEKWLPAAIGGAALILMVVAAHVGLCCGGRRSQRNARNRDIMISRLEAAGDLEPDAGIPLGPDDFGLLPRLFFVWNWPLILHGRKNAIKMCHVPPLDKSFKTARIAKKLNSVLKGIDSSSYGFTTLARESQTEDNHGPDPKSIESVPTQKVGRSSIIYSIQYYMLRSGIVTGGSVAVASGLLTSVAKPLMLRKVIDDIGSGQAETFDEQIVLLVGLSLVLFLEGWSQQLYKHYLTEGLGTVFIQTSFLLGLEKVGKGVLPTPTKDATIDAPNDDTDPVDAPKRKWSLWAPGKEARLSWDSSSNKPSLNGQNTSQDRGKKEKKQQAISATALFGNDVLRRMFDFREISGLLVGITSILGGTIILLLFIGWEGTLAGIGLMFLILKLNFWLAKWGGSVEKKNLEAADGRMGIMTEMVVGMKAVKFFSWESSYLSKLFAARNVECASIRQRRMLQVTSVTLGRASPVFASVASVLTYNLSGHELTAGAIFATISIYQSLRLPLIQTPAALTALHNLSASLDRLQRFLVLPTQPERKFIDTESEYALTVEGVDLSFSLAESTSKHIQETRSRSLILEEIDFKVKKGSLVAVVGGVGSGKSTLASAIVGELPPAKGLIQSHPSVGFVPQKAVIISGSIVDNVTMGRPLVINRLDEVLDMSCFVHDLDQLDNGIDTVIGERGTTLSGGQQQRLGIARALYADPELLVMDDPLSAVDPGVCNRIFNDALLSRKVAGKTTILVCNQLHLLRHCDHILYLESGRIAEQGKWVDMSKSGGSFQTLIDSFVIEDSHSPESSDFETIEKSTKKVKPRKSSIPSLLRAKRAETTKDSVGVMDNSVYFAFLRSFGLPFFGMTICVAICSFATLAYADVRLSEWIKEEEDSPGNTKNSHHQMGIYAATTFVGVCGMLFTGYCFCYGGYWASKDLHHNTAERITFAPLSWFQRTQLGEITSRFTSDLGQVDLALGFLFDCAVQIGLQMIAIFIIIAIMVPPVLAVAAVSFPLFYVLMTAVDKSNRELRRLANRAVAPVLSNLAEAEVAGQVARVMSCSKFFQDRHEEFADEFNRANYAQFTLMIWHGLSTVFLAFLIALSATSFVVFLPDIEDTQAGLAITYATLLPYYMTMLSAVYMACKTMFSSLERILEFLKVDQEAAHILDADKSLEKAWPQQGSIVCSNLHLRYGKEYPSVLKALNLNFKGGMKVGVVGRTGAGKSSLINALFRLTEIDDDGDTAGTILIDGVDIATVGLARLRSAITIVPQDPMLMHGTIQYNLDPFGEKSREEVESALESAGIAADKIDKTVERGGENLSAGEKQLLCFARALLFKGKIVVMDEPTASCDMETDRHVQDIVRKEFGNLTLLCIAHRLNTIIDYDEILVLDSGNIAEFGKPNELLSNPTGHLSRMVAALGPAAAEKLKQKAFETAAKLGKAAAGSVVISNRDDSGTETTV